MLELRTDYFVNSNYPMYNPINHTNRSAFNYTNYPNQSSYQMKSQTVQVQDSPFGLCTHLIDPSFSPMVELWSSM